MCNTQSPPDFSFSVYNEFSNGNSNNDNKKHIFSTSNCNKKKLKAKFEKNATAFGYKFNRDSKTIFFFPIMKTHYGVDFGNFPKNLGKIGFPHFLKKLSRK